MRQYIGLIHKEAASDYGVSFPDFPGVVTAAKDLDDARAMADEALALHIEGLVEDGEAIPEASSLEEYTRSGFLTQAAKRVIEEEERTDV
jgi:predicted RNase H-like HicB family nuclease